MPSLRGSILVSLQQREMTPDLPHALLTPDKARVLHHDETEYWDYKELLNLQNPQDEARFVKHALAFHNTQGGVLVVGVSDDFRVVGVTQNQIVDSHVLIAKLTHYAGRPLPLFSELVPLALPRKYLWLIFLPRRQGPPVAAARSGPSDKGGRLLVEKGRYYRRVHGESRPCIDPSDIEALFLGSSTEHLEAYTYDIDLPFYRLLAPACEQFVGRKDELVKLAKAVESRNPIIALDGPGGVGKTEIAIRFVRNAYDRGQFQFIISLSAKSKIWHAGRIEVRKPAFSGLSSFLQETATVLGLDVNQDVDQLKEEIKIFIKDSYGLIVVDNIEAVDRSVLEFLMDEIPQPVKVLVTSRVDRAVGARTISITQMAPEDARELLILELERLHYHGYLDEMDQAEELLKTTGRNPLAIKWAASLADQYKSLRLAATRLRGSTTQQREFLEFCFETMFDALSPLARDVAVLAIYLGDDWTRSSLTVALDNPPEAVQAAIEELKERGILVASTSMDLTANRLLPLTIDYLHRKWHLNKDLRPPACRESTRCGHRCGRRAACTVPVSAAAGESGAPSKERRGASPVWKVGRSTATGCTRSRILR